MSAQQLGIASLKELCKKHGADDVGVVEFERPALAPYKEDMLHAFSDTRSLVCLAKRVHSESIRSPVSYIKDTEFAYISKDLVSVAHGILTELFKHGVKGVAESGFFPLNSARWPGKIWTLPLKVLAVEAGLGHMGTNRLVLHPEFGAFVCFSGLLIDLAVNRYDGPLPPEHAPCLRCRLCVTACPTGAVRDSEDFGFVSCLTHNYRERLGGFIDWSEHIAASRNTRSYRNAVSDREAISMWQSLFCGTGTKCDHCMAVCPAGVPYATEYTADKHKYFARVVRPLVERAVDVFVVPGSDADFYIKRNASNTKIRYVSNGLRPASASDFLNSLPLVFQREPAVGLSARYHFTFTGCEQIRATVCIENQTLQVLDGHVGNADCSVIADSNTWIKALGKRQSLFVALLSRKVRVTGITYLKAFKRCFPDGA
jgi:epoxyqueuosine reductase QueG